MDRYIFEQFITQIDSEQASDFFKYLIVNAQEKVDTKKKRYLTYYPQDSKEIELTIENNKTSILTTGTEVDFLDIFKYIEDKKSKENQFEELYKYFNKDSNDVLLVGIKKVENKAINL